MHTSNTMMAIFKFDDATRQLFEGTVRPLVETHTGLKYIDGATYYAPHAIKMDLISRMIEETRLVIVDLSAMNPNVFIELGIAYAMKKPIVFLCSRAAWEGRSPEHWDQKLPFDLQGRELLIFSDEKDLKVKLGRYISDSLFKTREIAPLWDSLSKDNHVKSPSEIEIFSPGRVWSASAIYSSFTASCRVKIQRGDPALTDNPDLRFYISSAPEGYPCIVVVFPWEASEIAPDKYECHIDYFPGTCQGELTPPSEAFGPIRSDNRYDGRCSHHARLQQVSVARRAADRLVEFDLFVSFCWPNLVFESTLFEDKIDRLCVSLSSLRSLGYPVHLAQYIAFESINRRVTIESIRLKEVFTWSKE